MVNDQSRMVGQRSMGDGTSYPSSPPLTTGAPDSGDGVPYPLEAIYEYDRIDVELFDRPLEAGLERWQPLLPPLAPGTGLGEGNTPLVSVPDIASWVGLDATVSGEADVYLKDESQNPTWSQKDRLNRVVVSAAVHEDAAGIVASSSGNHGAAAAAYAARAGLPCVIFTAPETPAAVQEFIASYGATVIAATDDDARRRAVDRLADKYDYHPASSRTRPHTGHPYGPEGYKTIAYETYQQLGGRVPGAVFVPTCYAELFYGVWKGFRELDELGVVDGTPRMVACEPAVRCPHAAALAEGKAPVTVDPTPTEAYSIKAVTSSHRGLQAIRESDGFAATFTEAELADARERLARCGHWQEDSGAAGVAGLHATFFGEGETVGPDGATVDPDGNSIDPDEIDGPIVCIGTSSGFKNGRTREAPIIDGGWSEIREALVADGHSL